MRSCQIGQSNEQNKVWMGGNFLLCAWFFCLFFFLLEKNHIWVKYRMTWKTIKAPNINSRRKRHRANHCVAEKEVYCVFRTKSVRGGSVQIKWLKKIWKLIIWLFTGPVFSCLLLLLKKYLKIILKKQRWKRFVSKCHTTGYSEERKQQKENCWKWWYLLFL